MFSVTIVGNSLLQLSGDEIWFFALVCVAANIIMKEK